MGIAMANTQDMTEPAQMARLWCHEVMRVFYDRLTDDTDRLWLVEQLGKQVKQRFSTDINKLFSHLLTEEDQGQVGVPQARRLLFGDFGNPEGKRSYEEMSDPAAVIEVS